MNAKKAKALRKQVYGEMSHLTRQYAVKEQKKVLFRKVDGGVKREPVVRLSYTGVNLGLRKTYQEMKRNA